VFTELFNRPTYPRNGLLRIAGVLTAKQLSQEPEDVDGCTVVGKVGSTTDLTIGRLCGMESFFWPESGAESRELAIYNCKDTGAFALPGDSGALVFDGQGRMAGFLHAGVGFTSSYITFATPAWWVVEQIRAQYPHADFDLTTF
jgi:Peptidase family S64